LIRRAGFSEPPRLFTRAGALRYGQERGLRIAFGREFHYLPATALRHFHCPRGTPGRAHDHNIRNASQIEEESMFHSHGKNHRTLCGIALAACVVFASAAQADVTIKQTAKTSGLGGFLDSETKTVICIQNDKKCDETETRMTNKMMKMMGGGKAIKSASVINLEKGVVLNIDHQSKTCTEMPLEKIGEMAAQGMGQSGEGSPGMASDFDTSRVTMSPPKIDYQMTGKKEVIDGHPCEQGILTMEIEGVDNETGEKFKLITVIDAMLAQDIEGVEEYNQFNQKLVEKLGFEWDASGSQSMLSAMGSYGIDAKALGEEAAKMEGFPLVQTMTIRGEGGQFDAMKGGNGMEGADAAAKALQGLFGGGSDDDEGDGEGGGDNAIMTVTTRVTEISTGGIKGNPFAAPEKYKYLRPYAEE
jgi:hypothetical protein